jgi:glycosyltransferase involved in cell wall biosynthesis
MGRLGGPVPDRLRVLINGRFAAQGLTGVQRYAHETVSAIDQLLVDDTEVAARFDVSIALPDGATLAPMQRIRRVDVGGRASHLWEQTRLPIAARGAWLLNLNFSGPVLKRQQVITVHDAAVSAFPQAYSTAYRWVHDGLLGVLRHRAAGVMTVSEFSRRELAARYGIANAAVAIEGWQHSIAKGASDEVMQRHGLIPGRYMLAVGSVKPSKNFGLIIEAMRLLGGLPLKLVIAGATDTAIFRGEKHTLELAQMLGYVAESDLGHLYRNAAWFIFPSLYEGFGLPPLEAMANGCPVIAANAASIPEVCGDAALYFDPHSAESLAEVLNQVVRHPELRDRAIRRMPAQLARFSWHSNAERVLAHLGAVAGRPMAQNALMPASSSAESHCSTDPSGPRNAATPAL